MPRRSLLLALSLLLLLPSGAVPTATAAAAVPAFATTWGTFGTGNRQFDTPQGVAVGPSGDVFVVDWALDRVSRFSADGTFVAKWGSNGTAEGQLSHPGAIAVDSAGNSYVTDALNNRIQKFDAGGNFVSAWGWGVDNGGAAYQVCTTTCQAGTAGTGNGQFDRPNGIAVNSATSTVYVSDTWNNRIQRFTTTGTYLGKWGTAGTAEGQFSYPASLALDPSGNVGVIEWGNDRIQWFGSTGTFQKMWGWGVDNGTAALQVCTSGCQAGIAGAGDGQLFNAYGLAVEGDGTVYVADSGNERVQMFFPSGAFQGKWGTPGAAEGHFEGVYGVAVSATSTVYVTDTGNDRVQAFGPPTKLTIKVPRRVDAGSKARIRGSLTSDVASCVAGPEIVLKSRKRKLGTTTTAADGSYRFTVVIDRRTSLYAISQGPLCGQSTSPKKTIRV